MNDDNSIQAYVRGLVALGQAALEHHRRGDYFPADLTRQAQELLTLERTLGLSLSKDEPQTGPEPGAGALATNVASAKSGEDERLIVDVDDGLPQDAILPAEDSQPLVVSVEDIQESRSDIVAEDHQTMPDAVGSSEQQASRVEPSPSANPTCHNCGATLRVGKRFCHRCGTPIVAVYEASGLASRAADLYEPV